MIVRGYRRVSSKRQAHDGLSLDVQAERIAAWAVANGHGDGIVDYCDAGLSGYSKNADQRPELARLMAECEHGDIVVITKLDRLGRSGVELHRIYGEFERRGVDLVSIAEAFDTSTAGGKFMRAMLTAVAELEAAHIAGRVRDTAPARVERRKLPYGGGLRMYGRNRDYSICAEEADVVRRLIVPEILAGVSENRVANDLYAAGIVSAMGGRWWASTIDKVLRRPDLSGMINVPGGDRVIVGDFEPIIDRDTAVKLRLFLEARSQRPGKGRGRKPARPVLLRDLLTCGMCGGQMRPRKLRGRMMYVCRAREVDGSAACRQTNVEASLLDSTVYGWVESDLIDVSAMQAQVERAAKSEIAGARASAREADRELARMDSRLVTANRRWKDEEITTDEWREVKAEIKDDRTACEAEVAALTARVAALEADGAMVDAREWTYRYLTRLREAIDLGDNDETVTAVNMTLAQAFDTFTLVDGTDLRFIQGGVLPDGTKEGDTVTLATTLIATGQNNLFLEPVPLPGGEVGQIVSEGETYRVNVPRKIAVPVANYSNDSSQIATVDPRRATTSSSFPPIQTFVPRIR